MNKYDNGINSMNTNTCPKPAYILTNNWYKKILIGFVFWFKNQTILKPHIYVS